MWFWSGFLQEYCCVKRRGEDKHPQTMFWASAMGSNSVPKYDRPVEAHTNNLSTMKMTQGACRQPL